MSDQNVEISNTSALHQFFAQVTAHVPNAIQEHVGVNGIAMYVNQFIVVMDINRKFREQLDDIDTVTQELSALATKPDVEMNFVQLQFINELEPIWVFECTCNLADNLQLMANLFFSATELLECELNYYADEDSNNLEIDPESTSWLHEAQLILLKMPN